MGRIISTLLLMVSPSVVAASFLVEPPLIALVAEADVVLVGTCGVIGEASFSARFHRCDVTVEQVLRPAGLSAERVQVVWRVGRLHDPPRGIREGQTGVWLLESASDGALEAGSFSLRPLSERASIQWLVDFELDPEIIWTDEGPELALGIRNRSTRHATFPGIERAEDGAVVHSPRLGFEMLAGTLPTRAGVWLRESDALDDLTLRPLGVVFVPVPLHRIYRLDGMSPYTLRITLDGANLVDPIPIRRPDVGKGGSTQEKELTPTPRDK